MITYSIHFWHGFDQNLADQLMNETSDMVCMDGQNGDEYIWTGGLDKFNEEYGKSFIVIGDMICVASHINFNLN